LPFPSTLVGSRDDPYCDIARAQAFARAWGSTWVDYGARGHLNADSGLGDWPEGRVFVDSLLAGCSTPPAQP
jgi:predicted alpha/beta hydrolase family esterase